MLNNSYINYRNRRRRDCGRRCSCTKYPINQRSWSCKRSLFYFFIKDANLSIDWLRMNAWNEIWYINCYANIVQLKINQYSNLFFTFFCLASLHRSAFLIQLYTLDVFFTIQWNDNRIKGPWTRDAEDGLVLDHKWKNKLWVNKSCAR